MPRLRQTDRGPSPGSSRRVKSPLVPDRPPTLMAYFKRKGMLKETTSAQMYKARNMFISKGVSMPEIANELQIPIPILEQWSVIFNWQERRDERLFQAYRSIQTLARDKARFLDARHDRIGGTLETVVEQLLHQHMDPNDEFMLAPRDVKTLAAAIKDTQAIRRIITNQATQKVDINKTITLDTDAAFDNVRSMIENLFGARPQVSNGTTKRLEVSFPGGEVQDAEFEELIKDAD